MGIGAIPGTELTAKLSSLGVFLVFFWGGDSSLLLFIDPGRVSMGSGSGMDPGVGTGAVSAVGTGTGTGLGVLVGVFGRTGGVARAAA